MSKSYKTYTSSQFSKSRISLIQLLHFTKISCRSIIPKFMTEDLLILDSICIKAMGATTYLKS